MNVLPATLDLLPPFQSSLIKNNKTNDASTDVSTSMLKFGVAESPFARGLCKNGLQRRGKRKRN